MKPLELDNRHPHLVVFANDRGQPVAVPGTVVVKEGDVIRFKAVDVGPVSLVFPVGIVVRKEGEVESKAQVIELPLPDHGDVLVVVRRDREHRAPGVYAYTAFCRGSGIDREAIGGSQPKIIIYE